MEFANQQQLDNAQIDWDEVVKQWQEFNAPYHSLIINETTRLWLNWLFELKGQALSFDGISIVTTDESEFT